MGPCGLPMSISRFLLAYRTIQVAEGNYGHLYISAGKAIEKCLSQPGSCSDNHDVESKTYYNPACTRWQRGVLGTQSSLLEGKSSSTSSMPCVATSHVCISASSTYLVQCLAAIDVIVFIPIPLLPVPPPHFHFATSCLVNASKRW